MESPDQMKGDGSNAPESINLQNLYEEIKDKPCEVSKISVVGLKRTKEDIVMRELIKAREAKTLEDIQITLLDVTSDLMYLDVFGDVDITIDQGEKVSQTHVPVSSQSSANHPIHHPPPPPFQAQNNCNIVARISEKNLLALHSGIYAQGTEGTGESSIRLINPTGHAEQLSASLVVGTKSTTSYSLDLTKPRPLGNPIILDAKLHQDRQSKELWSSYCELVRGGVVTVATEDGHHALSHIAAWRQLSDPSGHASRAVLGQLGDSFKSAWRYVYSTNTFDNVGSPRSGWGYRAETEVTGLAPDPYLLRHIKHQIVTRLALPLTDTSTFSLTVETGALFPWGNGGMRKNGGGQRAAPLFEQINGSTTNTNGGSATTPISDRFFLGGLGPGALRGFRRCGVGPSDAKRLRIQRGGGDNNNNNSEVTPSVGELDRGRDALGGDLFFSILAAVNFEVPFEAAREVGIRGHVFLNGGSLVGLGGGGRMSGVKSSVNEMVSKVRWCVGAGLVWPTRIGMLEVNVCKVLSHQVNDRPMSGPGFQFGFSPSHW